MSEYNNNSCHDTVESTHHGSQTRFEPNVLKQIEVDLLLQYIVTPSVNENIKGNSKFEVVSVLNHSRQFLVNPEEKKGGYKFGYAKRRSWFLPKEEEHNVRFYNSKKNKDVRSSSGKLDFTGFLKWLELVGRKVYPQLDHGTAFVRFMECQIIPLYRRQVLSEEEEEDTQYTQKLAQAFELLDDDDVIKLLSIIYKPLLPLFKSYWDEATSRIMFKPPRASRGTPKSFLKFMTDYDLCPSLISQNNLQKLYSYLINILQRSEGEFDPCRLVLHDNQAHHVKGLEGMDSHMFMEALAMFAIMHEQVGCHFPSIFSTRKLSQ